MLSKVPPVISTPVEDLRLVSDRPPENVEVAVVSEVIVPVAVIAAVFRLPPISASPCTESVFEGVVVPRPRKRLLLSQVKDEL